MSSPGGGPRGAWGADLRGTNLEVTKLPQQRSRPPSSAPSLGPDPRAMGLEAWAMQELKVESHEPSPKAWEDREKFPMRLPQASQLPRKPKKQVKGCKRIARCLKKLDPRPFLRMFCAEMVEFFLFWFGAMRFEHSIADEFFERLKELDDALQVLDPEDIERQDKIKKKITAIQQNSAKVKSTKKSLKDPNAKSGQKHFGKVKRPKRNKAAVHPEAPRQKPILKVKVISASNLRRSDFSLDDGFVPPDPYFTCELVGKNPQSFPGPEDEIDVEPKTTNPVWNTSFDFLDYSIGDSLVFKLYDQDVGGDDLLGTMRLDPLDFYPDGFPNFKKHPPDEPDRFLESTKGFSLFGSALQESGEEQPTMRVQVDIQFPGARGWGGAPPRMRDKPKGWQAGEFNEEEQDDDDIVGQSPPVFVILQIAATVLVWMLGLAGDALPMSGLESFALGSTSLVLQRDCTYDYRWQAWRWFSYQFTHVGVNHILMNCLMMLLMGIPLEGFNGTLRTMGMFNLGVFGGACCWMLGDVHTETVGMSGGCYSLIGIMLGDLVLNWKEMKYAKTMLMMILMIPAVDLVQAVFAHAENVSNAAHLGGTFAGLIAAILIGRNVNVTTWEKRLRIASLVLGIGLAVISVLWAVSNPVPRTIYDEVRFCWHRQVISEPLFGDKQPHCVRCDSKACVEAWGTYVRDCGESCIMGTVSLGDCASQYGGWSSAVAPTTAPVLNATGVNCTATNSTSNATGNVTCDGIANATGNATGNATSAAGAPGR